MSVNNQALDILHDIISGRREAWDVLFAVAKHNPAVLVEAVSPDTAFVGSVLEALRHGNRIEAIKAIRAVRVWPERRQRPVRHGSTKTAG